MFMRGIRVLQQWNDLRSDHLTACCGELLYELYVDDDIAEALGGTIAKNCGALKHIKSIQ